MGDPRLQLHGVRLCKSVNLDMIVKDDILDMVLDNGKAITMRLNASSADGCDVAAYGQAGVFKLTNIVLEPVV